MIVFLVFLIRAEGERGKTAFNPRCSVQWPNWQGGNEAEGSIIGHIKLSAVS